VKTSKRAKREEEISGGLPPASESGILFSITGQFVRDLLLIKWHIEGEAWAKVV
jgi:hypothetical protein